MLSRSPRTTSGDSIQAAKRRKPGMDFNKIKDSLSEEDKKKIMDKAEEVKKDIGNRVGEKFGFGSKQEEQGISNRPDREMEPRDTRSDQEKEIASSDVRPDDTSEKDEETDEESAA